jgi:hypothetical protein
MSTVRRMRASDEDRQGVVGVLRDAHAAGRLPPGEFYERLDAAFAAVTWGDLDDLVADLPMSWTDAGLPSSLAASAAEAQDASCHPFLRAIVACAFVLALGLMIHVTAVALWAGCLLALFVVLLPLLSGRDRRNAGR